MKISIWINRSVDSSVQWRQFKRISYCSPRIKKKGLQNHWDICWTRTSSRCSSKFWATIESGNAILRKSKIGAKDRWVKFHCMDSILRFFFKKLFVNFPGNPQDVPVIIKCWFDSIHWTSFLSDFQSVNQCFLGQIISDSPINLKNFPRVQIFFYKIKKQHNAVAYNLHQSTLPVCVQVTHYVLRPM